MRRLWAAAIHQGRPERRAQQRDASETPIPISKATKKSFRRMKRLREKEPDWNALRLKILNAKFPIPITRKEEQ